MSTIDSILSSSPSVAGPVPRQDVDPSNLVGAGSAAVQGALSSVKAGSVAPHPFTIDQHCQHALLLAGQHVVAPGTSGNPLRRRLERAARTLRTNQRVWNRKVCDMAARLGTDGVAKSDTNEAIAGDALPPAAIALLENYHLVEEHIALAHQEGRLRHSSPLPQLAAGSAIGAPRIYHIASELIAHSDGQVDGELLSAVITAYQSRAALTLRELWAASAMLRLTVLEHLAKVAERLAGRPPASQANDHARSQAAEHVSIVTGIASLRNLGSIDWRGFVEEQSTVEAILRRDPLAIYPQMSPQSRNRYRMMVETLAIGSPLDESQVALAVVELANVGRVALDASARAGTVREGMKERHVGYFLVDKGRTALESRIGYRPNRMQSVTRAAASAPLACYMGAIAAVWFLAVAGVALLGWAIGAAEFLSANGAGALLLLWAGVASECAVRIVNSLCTMIVKPRAVMRLDFSEGIPDDCRTLVAVPTLLSSEQAIHDLVNLLEVRFLANRDPNLLFALVTDFPDAAAETLAGDAALLDLAQHEISRLNKRHSSRHAPADRCGRSAVAAADGTRGVPATDPGPFYLLHRPRKWNAQERKWMGEERKRGKLQALNQLLRGHDGEFSLKLGELDELLAVRYVITLDSDTQLPRDTARELIASMAHPLNRPRIDRQSRMVVEGHAILQPRVATTMPEARRSLYSHIFSGDAGTDPYTQQTSDVYQDVFGEGSFIGKGIYDVDAFETVLEGRFPDNRVLSHDLIEGCFARSGLIDDIELFEGFPSRLPADMSRRHRWIRGDWQIAAWLLPQAPTAKIEEGPAPKNPLSGLSRWKIADNLRRSTSPLALLAFIVAAWLLVPALAGWATALVFAAIFVPELMGLVPAIFLKPTDKPWSLHWADRAADVKKVLCREGIGWAMLPYTVHCNIDAIVRATYRMTVSRRKLLEWTTACEAERRCSVGCRSYYELIWACPVAGMAAIAWLAIVQPAALVTGGVLAAAWIAAPLVAWLISRPITSDAATIKDRERQNFRRWARRTWHFFDTFVNEKSNALPPDNVQFDEPWVVAPRTSPTNIGLGFLSDLSAHDLGYLPASRLIERTGKTLETLQKLERYRGHFYNWYDTKTLVPLGQRYVSAVDSGNLRGAFVVMQAAMEELRSRPLVSPRLCDGFQDSLGVLAEACGAEPPVIAAPKPGVRAALLFVDEVEAIADKLAVKKVDDAIVREWQAALRRQCDTTRRELAGLAFWLDDTCLRQLHAYIATLETSENEKHLREIRPQAAALGEAFLQADSCRDITSLRSLAEEAVARIGMLCSLLSNSQKLAVDSTAPADLTARLTQLAERATGTKTAIDEELRQIESLTQTFRQFCDMDYRFLYNKPRKLLAIGFNVSEHKLDTSCYDLLASECRLASFLAVSDGQLPTEHWSALGRTVAIHGGTPTLISWSGSMFEYLMPMLIMPSHRTSLLDTSCRRAVQRHISYATRLGLPWGISESCFHKRNDDNDYHYRAFGVPGLRLERRSDKSLVIAPYASCLASMVEPHAACDNLLQLEKFGALCSYGFYDAVDFTAEHGGTGEQPAHCRTVMSHHCGMSLVALANILLDSPKHGMPMRKRFMADAQVRAHDLLLQQRMPQTVRPVNWKKREAMSPLTTVLEANPPKVSVCDVFESNKTALVDAARVHASHSTSSHVATGCHGHVMSAAGSVGRYCYLRDSASGEFWSDTLKPTQRVGDKSQAIFLPGKTEFRMLARQINAKTLVSHVAEEHLEVRRIKLSNMDRLERTIELTTYAEVGQPAQVEAIVATAAGLAALHSISETTLPDVLALLAFWPPHSKDDAAGWMFHVVRAIDYKTVTAGFEISRLRFAGEDRTLAEPAAMDLPGELTSRPGTASDAILSIRRAVTLQASESVEIDIVTGLAATREEALAAIERHRDPRLSWRAFEIAEAHALVEHRAW
jgi:hypothetical protein